MNTAPTVNTHYIPTTIIIIIIIIYTERVFCVRKINHASFAWCCSLMLSVASLLLSIVCQILVALHQCSACFRNASLRDFVRLTVECIEEQQTKMFNENLCSKCMRLCLRTLFFFFFGLSLAPSIKCRIFVFDGKVKRRFHFSDIKFHPNICK